MSTVPAGWVTDRYDPHSFTNVGTYQGRANVLGIQITSAEGFPNRPPAFQSTFYNTQGRQQLVNGGPGSVLGADLYIPASWGSEANGSFRTDMWGVVDDNSNNVVDYPIIGFTNNGGPPRFRAWNNPTSSWVDLPTPVMYDAWTRLQIQFTGSNYVYFINGVPVVTLPADPTATHFTAVIMQAYNFYGDPNLSNVNPVNYTAYWANAISPADDAFQLKYFNTNYGSGQIIISNAGTMSSGSNATDDSTGTICANFYTFDPNEEMQTCCSCPVTPNGLSSLSIMDDIMAQNLIVNPSSAITVKVLFTLKSTQNKGGECDPTQASFVNLAKGGLAWGTNLRAVSFQGSPPSTVSAVTETKFSQAELSIAELSKLATYCKYVKILGSNVTGICKSCQSGARGSIGK
ncbi:MAG: hypothetical protein JSU00_16895 [Acidobacteria bacterium]|nr:hypothetical protein [Acidobacteriota bacterium]